MQVLKNMFQLKFSTHASWSFPRSRGTELPYQIPIFKRTKKRQPIQNVHLSNNFCLHQSNRICQQNKIQFDPKMAAKSAINMLTRFWSWTNNANMCHGWMFDSMPWLHSKHGGLSIHQNPPSSCPTWAQIWKPHVKNGNIVFQFRWFRGTLFLLRNTCIYI